MQKVIALSLDELKKHGLVTGDHLRLPTTFETGAHSHLAPTRVNADKLQKLNVPPVRTDARKNGFLLARTLPSDVYVGTPVTADTVWRVTDQKTADGKYALEARALDGKVERLGYDAEKAYLFEQQASLSNDFVSRATAPLKWKSYLESPQRDPDGAKPVEAPAPPSFNQTVKTAMFPEQPNEKEKCASR